MNLSLKILISLTLFLTPCLYLHNSPAKDSVLLRNKHGNGLQTRSCVSLAYINQLTQRHKLYKPHTLEFSSEFVCCLLKQDDIHFSQYQVHIRTVFCFKFHLVVTVDFQIGCWTMHCNIISSQFCVTFFQVVLMKQTSDRKFYLDPNQQRRKEVRPQKNRFEMLPIS